MRCTRASQVGELEESKEMRKPCGKEQEGKKEKGKKVEKENDDVTRCVVARWDLAK